MPTQTKSPLLLLVEDSEDDAYFFQRALERSGAECSFLHLPDGGAAMDFLRKPQTPRGIGFPHIIFLDLKMPVMNGFEVLEELRNEHLLPPTVPVIVTSGSEEQEDRTRAAQLGATEYLVKPVRAGELQRLLKDIFPRQIGAPA